MEGWHNQILQRIVRFPNREEFSREVYCIERNRAVAAERDKAGLSIVEEWSLSLIRWLEHLRRHPEFPAAKLTWVQDDMWLQTVRASAYRQF